MAEDERRHEIVSEFSALRRKKMLPQLISRVTAGMGVLTLLLAYRENPARNLDIGWLGLVAIGLLFAAMVTTIWGYVGWRCPACQTHLRVNDPKYCPDCGQRLKPL